MSERFGTFSRITGKPRIEQQIEKLIQKFLIYLEYFETNKPFDKNAEVRSPQWKSHRITLNNLQELGSAGRAAADRIFCDSLHTTLCYWGISGRSRLKPCDTFHKAISAQASKIAALDGIMIGDDDPRLNVNQIASEVWAVINSLEIVECHSKIVSGTKALHHLLSNLVVPMDNEHTKPFFGWVSIT